jgi:hypothetical protein
MLNYSLSDPFAPSREHWVVPGFVDTGHPALLRMWANRQRGYRTMGYRVGGDETTKELY